MEVKRETLINNWTRLLAVNFAGMGYWLLSKEYKQKVYREVAQMIYNDVEFLLQENAKIKADDTLLDVNSEVNP